MAHRLLQHIGHLHMIVDIGRYVRALQSLLPGFGKQSLYLSIQTVAHQFEGDVRVAIDTRRLSLRSQELEHLVDVGHVEVTTKTEVLGAPVIAAQERMHVLQSALACGGIAQMAH